MFLKCSKTLEKCRKHSPAARAFHISLVFSNACRVLSQCNTRLRLLYLLNISYTGTTQKCPYVFTVEKSITVETSVQYSIQKYDHLTADRVMTANIKSLVFYVIMTPFPFYKNMLNFSGWSCSYKNGALLAKFQPGVLNPFVVICGCLLYCVSGVKAKTKNKTTC